MEASDQSSPSITELKWWRKRCVTLTQSYFWILLCKGYDTAAAMMIAVLWAWIVPLVAYPKKGCPADGNECWDFCGFLFFYICLATALLPLVAVVLQGRCSRLAVEMHRRGNRVRRKFFERARHLLLGSVGSTWSVANSQFLLNVVRQAAYTGSYHDDGDNDEDATSGGGGAIGDHNTTFGHVNGTFNGTFSQDSTVWSDNFLLTHAINTTTTTTTTNATNAETALGGSGGGVVGEGAMRITRMLIEAFETTATLLLRLNDQHERRHLSSSSSSSSGSGGGSSSSGGQNGVFVSSGGSNGGNGSGGGSGGASSSSEEMWWGVLACFSFGVGYFALAVASIWCVSACCEASTLALEWLGCSFSQSAYAVELSLLLQNHWYYVCGYSWALFWTYVWFGSALVTKQQDQDQGDESFLSGPWFMLLLDVARAVLFTAAFSHLALKILPFKVNDLSPSASEPIARVRLLIFRSTAVVVAVALADLPTSFVVEFLANDQVLDLPQRKQLSVLYGFALFGLVVLSHVDLLLCQRLEECSSSGNSSRNSGSRLGSGSSSWRNRRRRHGHGGGGGSSVVSACFWREVCTWLVAFLVLSPWLRSLTLAKQKVFHSDGYATPLSAAASSSGAAASRADAGATSSSATLYPLRGHNNGTASFQVFVGESQAEEATAAQASSSQSSSPSSPSVLIELLYLLASSVVLTAAIALVSGVLHSAKDGLLVDRLGFHFRKASDRLKQQQKQQQKQQRRRRQYEQSDDDGKDDEDSGSEVGLGLGGVGLGDDERERLQGGRDEAFSNDDAISLRRWASRDDSSLRAAAAVASSLPSFGGSRGGVTRPRLLSGEHLLGGGSDDDDDDSDEGDDDEKYRDTNIDVDVDDDAEPRAHANKSTVNRLGRSSHVRGQRIERKAGVRVDLETDSRDDGGYGRDENDDAEVEDDMRQAHDRREGQKKEHVFSLSEFTEEGNDNEELDDEEELQGILSRQSTPSNDVGPKPRDDEDDAVLSEQQQQHVDKQQSTRRADVAKLFGGTTSRPSSSSSLNFEYGQLENEWLEEEDNGDLEDGEVGTWRSSSSVHDGEAEFLDGSFTGSGDDHEEII